MYIIAIGWLWVAFMMAIAETSVVAGILTFIFYGMLPCGLIVYLMGTPARRRRQQAPRERPDDDIDPPAAQDRQQP